MPGNIYCFNYRKQFPCNNDFVIIDFIRGLQIIQKLIFYPRSMYIPVNTLLSRPELVKLRSLFNDYCDVPFVLFLNFIVNTH